MNNLDRQYKQLISQVLRFGSPLETRGTKSTYMFGTSIRHDLRSGFPTVTLRNVHPLSAIKEMLIWDLQSYGLIDHPGLSKGLRKVWSNYDNGNGYVSNSYSKNWRAWPAQQPTMTNDPRGNVKSTQTDQILKLVNDIRNNPTSRSHVLQAYNPGAKDSMPHCHPSAVFSSDGQCLDLLVMGR